MNIREQNISVQIIDEDVLVSLKWLRGASRYNNGATKYKRKHLFRYLINKKPDK